MTLRPLKMTSCRFLDKAPPPLTITSRHSWDKARLTHTDLFSLLDEAPPTHNHILLFIPEEEKKNACYLKYSIFQFQVIMRYVPIKSYVLQTLPTTN